MTNGEKYKTAQERAEAFEKFCKSNTTDEGLCMPDCKLFHAHDDSKCYRGNCEFHWLDLEAEEEKPLPCPFCGNENAELRECLKKFYDLEFPMGYEGIDGEWLALAKATEKALAKAFEVEVAK